VKARYYKSVYPPVFPQGKPVLTYDQDKYTLGEGNFEPNWCNPDIVRCFLWNGVYEIIYYEENQLDEPHNWIYLKTYFA
jgi:hypothetical protein